MKKAEARGSRRAPRSDGRRGVRILGGCLVALALLLAVAASAGAATSLPRLHAANGAIRDSHGRQVILRGVNVTALTDQYLADPKVRATVPLRPADYRRMRSMGFNVIRLPISWSRLEPQRGQISEGYIDRIRNVVSTAADYGMYTIIDMHSGGWGKYVATPPGATCPRNWRPSQGWNGAPDWATFTDGRTTCHSPRAHKRTPAVMAAWSNFWLNRDGIQAEMVAAWMRLAGAFARQPAVAGYDLLNEPDPGTVPHQLTLLDRFYRGTIGAIRLSEDDAGGAGHIVFFEPDLTWSMRGLVRGSPSVGFSTDDNLVFAPHLYAGAVHHLDRGVGKTTRLLNSESSQAVHRARAYGTPLWAGEWGFSVNTAHALRKIKLHTRTLDKLRLGSAWWQWKIACGFPTLYLGPQGPPVPPQLAGNLNPIHCPDGVRKPSPPGWVATLARPHPREAPGKLTALRASGSWLSLRGASPCGKKLRRSQPKACRLVVWSPRRGHRRSRPKVTGHNLHGVHVHRIPGGWITTASVTGRYSLTAWRAR